MQTGFECGGLPHFLMIFGIFWGFLGGLGIGVYRRHR